MLPRLSKVLALPCTVGILAGFGPIYPGHGSWAATEPTPSRVQGACPCQEQLDTEWLQPGVGRGADIHPPEGFAVIESLCLIEESPVLCEIRERAPLRFVMGTRGISARVYMARGGSFMFNSYEDSLAGKESILKPGSQGYSHTQSLYAEVSALLAHVLLNLVFDGKEEI